MQTAQDGNVPDQTEIIITATKREENLQNVPISVQAIGTRRLDQLNISNFEQYTKQLPSVSFQTAQPGLTVVYMRGVATGGDGNHSGSLPSVGTYLDEANRRNNDGDLHAGSNHGIIPHSNILFMTGPAILLKNSWRAA